MPQVVTHTWRKMSKTHVSEETERSGRRIPAASSFPGFAERMQASSSSWLPGKHQALQPGWETAQEKHQVEPAEPRLGALRDTRKQNNHLRGKKQDTVRQSKSEVSPPEDGKPSLL